MAMTASVKDELSRLSITKPCCRKAEVSAILRFAGGLHITSGKIMIEVELDTAQSARRLRKDISDVYGHESDLAVITSGGLRKGSRYVVRVIKDGDALARQTGLVDSNGRPVRGLPPQVVSASLCDAEAAWRGAFIAHGSLTEPGRSSALEITCPGPEAALALVGSARRLGIVAKAREVRGVDRVVIRDGDAIGVLLTRLGAHESVLAWEERRMRREVRATANRLANFDDANLRRSARAAVAASARVQRAMEILAADIPQHLKEAGELRIQHGQASLEELGSLASPPMTKDAIAGRIRRLLAMADKRAHDLGIPDTEAGLTPDMLG
ncbi:MAG: DNA-binding protein WhiA [Candidatus Nanopelagicaceae bacterium]|jgi:DNA-binding protein WhiA|nr:DNA-binding protein WhiA [Actinomycetota bacterium]NDF10221.1 DNA-binding protein WhiA [Actinomycetota bacterium]